MNLVERLMPGISAKDFVRSNLVYCICFKDSVGFEVQKYAIKTLQLFLHLKENLNEKLLSHDFYNDAL